MTTYNRKVVISYKYSSKQLLDSIRTEYKVWYNWKIHSKDKSYSDTKEEFYVVQHILFLLTSYDNFEDN